jgi:hypothetical protein
MAVALVGAAFVEPLEGLEQPADLGGRDDGSGAGHRQDGAAVPGSGRDLKVAADDVVPDGVVDQLSHQPPGHQLVAEQGRLPGDGLLGQVMADGLAGVAELAFEPVAQVVRGGDRQASRRGAYPQAAVLEPGVEGRSPSLAVVISA